MHKYLIAFTYHTHHDWAISQLTGEALGSQSSGLFVSASSEDEAMAWGREIALGFTDYLNQGLEEPWPSPDHECWVADPLACEWTHSLGFLQSVKPGQFPNYDSMTWAAYVDWQERYGSFGT